MPNVEPHRLAATEVARRIEDGSLSAEAVVASCLDHIKSREGTVRELERTTAVFPVDDRLDAVAGSIRSGVHVGNQPDRMPVATAHVPVGARKRGEHVAVVVQARILKAGVAQLGDEQAAEVELTRRTRR